MKVVLVVVPDKFVSTGAAMPEGRMSLVVGVGVGVGEDERPVSAGSAMPVGMSKGIEAVLAVSTGITGVVDEATGVDD